MTKWTRFSDMSSGGGQKEDFSSLYIEAPEEEAKIIFYNRFGHDPERVTCSCCGDDYSISESDSLADATAYSRNCMWTRKDGWIEQSDPKPKYGKPKEHISVERFVSEGGTKGWHGDAKFIFAKDITDAERV